MENPKKPNIVTSDMFYTLDIRTCTGGGLKKTAATILLPVFIFGMKN